MKEGEPDNGGVSDKPQEATGSANATVGGPAQPTEIAASIVRSSLAEIETQATTALGRLEHIKGSVRKQQPPQGAENSQEKMTPQNVPLKEGNHGPQKKTGAEVMARLEGMISDLDVGDEQECLFPPLDEATNLAVLQHSTAAYIGTLDRPQINRLVSRLDEETNEWLSYMFKLPLWEASYYRQDAECLLHAVRLALLNLRYENGDRVAPSAATIYLSDIHLLFPVENACRYLGLPVTCVRFMATERGADARDAIGGRMDLTALEYAMESDATAGQVPMMVISSVGSALTGVTENLDKLVALCASRRIWLHCQGLGLAALALTNTWLSRMPNSMTLSLNTWLGLNAVSSVLVYHAPGGISATKSIIANMFDSDPIMSNRLDCLSVWAALQSLGVEKMQERIFSAFASCQELSKMLSQLDGINVLTKQHALDSKAALRMCFSRAGDYWTLFDVAVPAVVFCFDGHTGPRFSFDALMSGTTTDGSLEESEAETRDSFVDSGVPTDPPVDSTARNASNGQYYNRLNNWLGQNLLQEAPQLSLEVIEHDEYGTVIRYCPFELGYGEQLPRDAGTLRRIASCIEMHIEIMRSTIRHRVRFEELVAQSGVLRLVELKDWAGLGGVHYVPEGWEGQEKGELNKLNAALVEALQNSDCAFSHAESGDGLICVRFGMVTGETDMQELIELVIQTSRAVQENSKVLDTMSEILQKGIEAATKDLQREAEEKLWQEGILRQVPLVGRVVNWLNPPAKETGMKGRSLNLTQGVVESTENIYKYHMQMTPKTTNQLPGNKAPPAPLVQKPISAELRDQPLEPSVQHSRNASSSSEPSRHDVVAAAAAAAAAVGRTNQWPPPGDDSLGQLTQRAQQSIAITSVAHPYAPSGDGPGVTR